MIEIKVREQVTEDYIKEVIQEDNIIHWVITKKDIKNNNYSKILKLLKMLSDEGIRSKSKLRISFYRYGNNQKTVYVLNDEVRNYVRKLVNRCPYIFYFLNNYSDSLIAIMISIFDKNNIYQISPTDFAYKWSYDEMLEIVKPIIDYCRSINEMPENIESLILKMFNIRENDIRVQSVHRAIELHYNKTL